MRIGELAARTGVTARTIRFYEDKGILPASERTPAGYRLYDDHAVRRLHFLRAAQDAGLTLAEIAGILEIRSRGEAPCSHTRHLLDTKRDEVEKRLRHLHHVRDELDRLLAESRDVHDGTCRPDSICSIIPSREIPS
jgi:DNA-binding transcriptional MerR regulator